MAAEVFSRERLGQSSAKHAGVGTTSDGLAGWLGVRQVAGLCPGGPGLICDQGNPRGLMTVSPRQYDSSHGSDDGRQGVV